MTFHNAPRRHAFVIWVAAAIAAAAPCAVSAQGAPDASASSASSASQAAGSATVRQVTITARNDKIRSSPDARSYDITHDPQATTGAVADVLRNVPSVQVSPDGAVSLRGDSNVVIYVDGKPSSLFKGQSAAQALQSMPADMFERVEVMTNPSAAYSPDGAAGIINLITKKTRKPGRWGSLKLSGGSAGRRKASFTASQKTDKLTLTFSAGVGTDKNAGASGDRRESLDGSGRIASTLDSASRNSSHGDYGWAYGSAEWSPDAKTQVTAELNGFAYGGRWASESRLATTESAGDLAVLMQRRVDGNYAGSGVTGGLTYRRTFDSDLHTLVVSLTRDRATNSNPSATTQLNLMPAAPDSFDDQRRGDARAKTQLKGDYTRPMPFGATLKAGFDIRDEPDVLDNSGFIAAASPEAPGDPGQTDLFRFDQRTAAGYGTYNQPVGRLTVLAGVRAEDTRIDLNDETTRFTTRTHDLSFYPTVHLGWKLTERQRLTASYSERIQRPQPFQFDPFRFVSGPFSQNSGNPNLAPELSRKVELGWERKAGGSFYSATAYYKRSEGGFSTVTTDLGSGVFLSSPANLSRSSNGGLELVASGRLTKSVNYNLSGNLYRNQIDASALGFPVRSGWMESVHGGVDWQATPKDLLQVQGWFNGRQLTPQGYSESGPQLSLGFRHKVDDRFALQLTAQDVFLQAYNHYASDGATFHDVGWRKARDRVAYATLIWSFGRGPKKDPGFDDGPAGPTH